MKKFTKIILLTSLFSFIIGLIIILCSLSGGGFSEIMSLSKQKLMEIPITEDIAFGLEFDNGDCSVGFFPKDKSSGNIVVGSGEKNKVESDIDIKAVNIEIGYGDVEIRPSEDSYIYYSVEGNFCDYKTDVDAEGVFNFKTKDGKIHITDAGKAVFYIPQNAKINNYTVNMGAGDLEIDDINVYENANINMGAGEIHIGQLKANQVCINCATGDTVLDKVCCEKFKASCSCGDFQAKLEGKYEDYNYDVEAALGNIEVGDKSISGMGSIDEDNNSEKNVEIKCALGNIEVEFD